MRLLDRLIRRTIIVSTLIVSAIIIALQSFLSLVQQFNFLGEHGYHLSNILLFVPMQIPAQYYQLFPMAGFLGALIGLGRLSASSELIIMRASGVSIMQIAWSVLKTAMIMIIVVTVIGEGLGPLFQQKSAQMQQAALSSPNASLLKSVWLHEGNSFTHIGALKNHDTMIDITHYRFAPTGRLLSATNAVSGRLANQHWILSHLKQTLFLNDRVSVKTQQHALLHVTFQPVLQMQMAVATAEQTMLALYETIQYRHSIGLSINQYVFSFWQRLVQPITSLVMICLSVPFVFGSMRSASMGLRIMLGILIGFLFYMLNQLFGPITLVYQFPPLWAAVIPTVLFFLIALLLLSRAR
jgi:lipopolysaccharide export system permease protein